MTREDIVILDLPQMRVAVAYGFGQDPELNALCRLQSFAKSRSLLVDGELPPVYGFNNPNPSPGSPNYGYEVWLPVDDHVEPEEGIQIIFFPGGRYAVMRCHGLEHIGSDWQELAKWRETTHYLQGKYQWLEKLLSPP